MKPPKQDIQYERVPIYDDWINGTIREIEYDMEHKRIWKGVEKIGPAVRIIIDLDNCKFPRKTPWLSFLYTEKSNLYKIFICGLVNDPKPNMEFDLDLLKNMKIKAIYKQNGEFDNLAMIKPQGPKISSTDEVEEKIPF